MRRVDRHAPLVEAIRRDLLTGPGVTERADRARVMSGDSPREVGDYLEKVRTASYRVTDEDIAALRRSGLTEDQIYELTVAAAVGIAYDRLAAARRAMKSTA